MSRPLGNADLVGPPSSNRRSAGPNGPAVHLLQLAEDTELAWGWGDAGTLYFTIPVKALATGDFSQAVAQALCC
ncbi:DUF1963 domain-containing protein [Streptomyces sp. NPDC003753]